MSIKLQYKTSAEERTFESLKHMSAFQVPGLREIWVKTSGSMAFRKARAEGDASWVAGSFNTSTSVMERKATLVVEDEVL